MTEIDTQTADWILVSGASGFIGRALCATLQANDYGVIALSRNPGRTQQLLKDLAPERLICCDLSAVANLRPKAIINLAGANIAARRWSARRKQTLRDSRIKLTETLMDIAQKHWQDCLTLVISGSAIGYYGDAGDTELTESAPPGGDFAATLCQDWEAAVPDDGRFRRAILRLGIVLGPPADGGALATMRLPFGLGLGATFAGGAHWQAWIAREDVIAAILHIMDHRALAGPFNLVAPVPATNREFTLSVAAALGRPAFLNTPKIVTQALFGEMSTLLLASQRVIPERLLSSGFTFRYTAIDDAMKAALH
ncbi:TIGR01777 family oxidoreductase [Spongiibacter taiwanensis]|uniref:TIGR01777 family oxidoreductase n=1 Tax=Spongiibacter taiwanensis TaxID=1748242 RepID=UPI002034B516|nr:TIGR01777 family oxidoreductase [Spongiibacter taiwanensis]USA44776.1 TIGR01777 family oxidoreductase [Spongiibacter taiwanensis]